jgi:hypothetical protein
MQLLLERIFGFVFLLVGLSHLLQPGPWVDFFKWLRSKTYGGFVVVIYTLPIAIVIVTFHNRWELRSSLILTLAGWIMLVKCVIYAVYPIAFSRTATRAFTARSSVIGGIILIAVSLLLLLDTWSS